VWACSTAHPIEAYYEDDFTTGGKDFLLSAVRRTDVLKLCRIDWEFDSKPTVSQELGYPARRADSRFTNDG
jgi:hypothetical protein